MVNFVEYGFLCDVISLDIKIQRRANIIFENKTPLIYINNVLAIPYSSNSETTEFVTRFNKKEDSIE